jgi:hypothetical protein
MFWVAVHARDDIGRGQHRAGQHYTGQLLAPSLTFDSKVSHSCLLAECALIAPGRSLPVCQLASGCCYCLPAGTVYRVALLGTVYPGPAAWP